MAQSYDKRSKTPGAPGDQDPNDPNKIPNRGIANSTIKNKKGKKEDEEEKAVG